MDGKARMSRFFSQLLMIFVGIVVVYLVVDFGGTVIASRHLNRDLEDLRARLRATNKEQRRLEDRVRYAYSEQAVDVWAREIGLSKENEVAVTLLNYGEAPEPPVREKPRTTPASIPARRVWWDLFFAEQ